MQYAEVQYVNKEMRRRFPEGLAMEPRRAERLKQKGDVIVLNQIDTNMTSVKRIGMVAAIPFAEKMNIGRAYNNYIYNCPDEWVVLMDYDVLLVNPQWYNICKTAIARHGKNCGLFTCYTNRIGCPLQRAPGVNDNCHDMIYHRQFAKKIYNTNLGQVVDHSHAKYYYSGMFMLTSKKAWEFVGGFKEKEFFGVDVDYCRKIRRAGLKTMLMSDLYVYHGYFREVLKPFFAKE